MPSINIYDPVFFEVVKNAPLAADVKFTPLIFCHGFASNCTTNSGHCRELASHGFLVLAPDFHDGTCSYTEMERGKHLDFDPESLQNFMPKRHVQLK